MRNIDLHTPDINAAPLDAFGHGEILTRHLTVMIQRRAEWPRSLRNMTAMEVGDEFALLAALDHELQHSQHWIVLLLRPYLTELVAAVQSEAAARHLTLVAGADPRFLAMARDMATEIIGEP